MRKNFSGFTLIELLVYFSVVVLIISIVWSGLSAYRDSQSLSSSAEVIIAAISEARSKTLSSKGDSEYGVYLEPSRVTIFRGKAFDPSDLVNEILTLENSVRILSTNLSVSTSTIYFKKITGETDNFGSITISLKSDEGKTNTILLSKTGQISR